MASGNHMARFFPPTMNLSIIFVFSESVMMNHVPHNLPLNKVPFTVIPLKRCRVGRTGVTSLRTWGKSNHGRSSTAHIHTRMDIFFLLLSFEGFLLFLFETESCVACLLKRTCFTQLLEADESCLHEM